MKIKTSELTDMALDWAAGVCAGHSVRIQPSGFLFLMDRERQIGEWKPSKAWAQGGPIIQREGIAISPSAAGLNSWVADMPLKPTSFADKTRCAGTPLIAAMRVFVASKLGSEVDVPEELC